jgi:hypothetical protein
MRKVANSDSGRLRSLETLIAKHPKVIVFYNFDYELDSLRTLVNGLTPTPASTDSLKQSKTELPSVSAATQRSTLSTGRSIDGSTKSTTTGTGDSPQQKKLSSDGSLKLVSGELSMAEWNGHKHQAIPVADRWVYLVQYQAGSEGWNCIDTNAMCFYSLTYSYKNWHQAHGRIDRLNTPFSTLYYYVLLSNSVIDRAIWRALTEKRSFNEKQFLSTHSQKV